MSYNPVVISYAVVTVDSVHIFIDETKLTESVRSHLDGVCIHPYLAIEAFLTNLATNCTHGSASAVLVDPSQLNWRLYRSLGASTMEGTSPITLPKSLKHEAELSGIRQSHLRDGAALTAFLCWLEAAVRAAPNSISEFDVTEKIEEFRGKADGHVSPSFR